LKFVGWFHGGSFVCCALFRVAFGRGKVKRGCEDGRMVEGRGFGSLGRLRKVYNFKERRKGKAGWGRIAKNRRTGKD